MCDSDNAAATIWLYDLLTGPLVYGVDSKWLWMIKSLVEFYTFRHTVLWNTLLFELLFTMSDLLLCSWSDSSVLVNLGIASRRSKPDCGLPSAAGGPGMLLANCSSLSIGLLQFGCWITSGRHTSAGHTTSIVADYTGGIAESIAKLVVISPWYPTAWETTVVVVTFSSPVSMTAGTSAGLGLISTSHKVRYKFHKRSGRAGRWLTVWCSR